MKKGFLKKKNNNKEKREEQQPPAAAAANNFPLFSFVDVVPEIFLLLIRLIFVTLFLNCAKKKERKEFCYHTLSLYIHFLNQ